MRDVFWEGGISLVSSCACRRRLLLDAWFAKSCLLSSCERSADREQNVGTEPMARRGNNSFEHSNHSHLRLLSCSFKFGWYYHYTQN